LYISNQGTGGGFYSVLSTIDIVSIILNWRGGHFVMGKVVQKSM